MPKDLILFEEGDWSINQEWFNRWYGPVKVSHKHKNIWGKERWIPINMDHGFYTLAKPPGEAWKYQCGKCGEDAPSELKTRFKLLDDE